MLAAAQISSKIALEIYVQIRHPLGQAVGLYYLGIISSVRQILNVLVGSFQGALCSHTQTGNVKGQADDLNKIFEVYLPQGSIQEALTRMPDALEMPVHIQIEDVSRQGDDIHIQAGSLSRFDDAENKMKGPWTYTYKLVVFMERPETRRFWALFYGRSLEKDVPRMRSYVTRSQREARKNSRTAPLGYWGGEAIIKRAGADR